MPKKVPKSIRLSSKARKMLTIACAILVFLFALGITLYPLISNWYNSRHQSEIHTQYLEVLRQVDNSEIILAERYANEYNAAISPAHSSVMHSPKRRCCGHLRTTRTC